jgi:hypothetical protein
MKLVIPKGATSRIVTVFIQNNSLTTGAGLSGLDQTSAIVGGYVREGGVGVALTVDENVTTEGTYQAPSVAGKVRIGTPANLPAGFYELHFHNDLWASGAEAIAIGLGGATNMAPLTLEVQLSDPVRGLGSPTALPNAAADAAGGLPISDAGGLDLDAQRTDVAAILVDTGTTLDGRIPAALVGGRMDASIGAVVDGVLTAAKFAAGAFDAVWSVAARLLTAGTNIVLAKGTGITGFNDPTVGAIADQVWDEAIAGHLGAGSTGAALNGAGAAGDPWTTPIPGAYGAGTAGKIVGDALDAAVSSRASAAQATAIEADTQDLQVQVGVDGAGLTAIGDARLANLDATVASRATPAQVNAEADQALADYDGPTKAELDAAVAPLATAGSVAALAADLVAVLQAVDTEVAAILVDTDVTIPGLIAALDTLIDGVKAKTDNLPAAPAAVSDIPTAVQNADALLGRSIAGGANGGRTVTSALRRLRNRVAIAGGTLSVYQENDSTVDHTAAVTTAAGNPITEVDPA